MKRGAFSVMAAGALALLFLHGLAADHRAGATPSAVAHYRYGWTLVDVWRAIDACTYVVDVGGVPTIRSGIQTTTYRLYQPWRQQRQPVIGPREYLDNYRTEQTVTSTCPDG